MKRDYPVTSTPRMRPSHPGELLREDVLPALGLSVTEAARRRRGIHHIPGGRLGMHLLRYGGARTLRERFTGAVHDRDSRQIPERQGGCEKDLSRQKPACWMVRTAHLVHRFAKDGVPNGMTPHIPVLRPSGRTPCVQICPRKRGQRPISNVVFQRKCVSDIGRLPGFPEHYCGDWRPQRDSNPCRHLERVVS